MKAILASIYRNEPSSKKNFFAKQHSVLVFDENGVFNEDGLQNPQSNEHCLKIVPHPAGNHCLPIAIPCTAEGEPVEIPGHSRAFGGDFINCFDERFLKNFSVKPGFVGPIFIQIWDRFDLGKPLSPTKNEGSW